MGRRQGAKSRGSLAVAPPAKPLARGGGDGGRAASKNGRGKWLSIFGAVLLSVFSASTGAAVKTLLEPRPPDATPIQELIRLEAALAVAEPRDAGEARYGDLFLENGWVVDVRAQQFWTGKPQILERFQSLPRFETLEHVLLDTPKFVDDSTALARTTTKVTFQLSPAQSESRFGHEEWTFLKSEGRWRIRSFEFNVP